MLNFILIYRSYANDAIMLTYPLIGLTIARPVLVAHSRGMESPIAKTVFEHFLRYFMRFL